MNEFLTLVSKRESCRDFSDRPVERENLLSILEAARLAPSACNSQPWSYVVSDKPEISELVAQSTQKMGMNKFTSGCPVFITVINRGGNASSKAGEKVLKKDFSTIDVGISVAHLCLAAQDAGLSTCILGWFSADKLRRALALSLTDRVELVIAVGYAREDILPRPKKRRKIDEIVRFAGEDEDLLGEN